MNRSTGKKSSNDDGKFEEEKLGQTGTGCGHNQNANHDSRTLYSRTSVAPLRVIQHTCRLSMYTSETSTTARMERWWEMANPEKVAASYIVR